MNIDIRNHFQHSKFHRNYGNTNHIISNFEKIENQFNASELLHEQKMFLILRILHGNKLNGKILEQYILFLVEEYNIDFCKYYKFDITTGNNELIGTNIMYELLRSRLSDMLSRVYDHDEIVDSIYMKNTYFPMQRLNSCRKISEMKMKIGHNNKKYIKYSKVDY
jgi:hypothetical protein